MKLARLAGLHARVRRNVPQPTQAQNVTIDAPFSMGALSLLGPDQELPTTSTTLCDPVHLEPRVVPDIVPHFPSIVAEPAIPSIDSLLVAGQTSTPIVSELPTNNLPVDYGIATFSLQSPISTRPASVFQNIEEEEQVERQRELERRLAEQREEQEREQNLRQVRIALELQERQEFEDAQRREAEQLVQQQQHQMVQRIVEEAKRRQEGQQALEQVRLRESFERQQVQKNLAWESAREADRMREKEEQDRHQQREAERQRWLEQEQREKAMEAERRLAREREQERQDLDRRQGMFWPGDRDRERNRERDRSRDRYQDRDQPESRSNGKRSWEYDYNCNAVPSRNQRPRLDDSIRNGEPQHRSEPIQDRHDNRQEEHEQFYPDRRTTQRYFDHGLIHEEKAPQSNWGWGSLGGSNNSVNWGAPPVQHVNTASRIIPHEAGIDGLEINEFTMHCPLSELRIVRRNMSDKEVQTRLDNTIIWFRTDKHMDDDDGTGAPLNIILPTGMPKGRKSILTMQPKKPRNKIEKDMVTLDFKPGFRMRTFVDYEFIVCTDGGAVEHTMKADSIRLDSLMNGTESAIKIEAQPDYFKDGEHDSHYYQKTRYVVTIKDNKNMTITMHARAIVGFQYFLEEVIPVEAHAPKANPIGEGRVNRKEEEETWSDDD